VIWLKLFNIRKEEAGIVSNFFFHHFFLGLGLALLLLVSETLFISLFPVSYFPLVFIVSAAAMMLTGRVYSYFEHKLPFNKLLPLVLFSIIAITLLIWLLFFIKSFVILPVILFIVFRIIYLLSNLEFWGLSSVVFDVRQGKRLFGFISSGDMPAKLLGYLSVYLFVPIIGLQNLLPISALAFIISLYFLQKIFKHSDYSQEYAKHTKNSFSDKTILKSFFGSNFIFSLAILAFLAAVAIAIIEYAFLSIVKTKYHSQEDLAAFLSIFLIIGYSITLIIKVLLSGRLSAHAGIKKSLMILPVIVIGVSLAYFYLEFREYSLHDSLMFICLLFISTSIVRYSINDPVFLVMFQPLQTQLRLKGHTIIKGFIQPLALGFVGFLIWLITILTEEVNYSYLNFALISISILWIVAIVFSNKHYLHSLGEAIRKRFILGTDLGVLDKGYFDLLLKKLDSERTEEVAYAISSLEKSNLSLLKSNANKILLHKNEFILELFIKIIGNNNWKEFSDDLFQIFEKNSNDVVRSKAIQVYCSLNEDITDEFLNLIGSKSIQIRTFILIGLLQSNFPERKQFANNQLKSLCVSVNVEENLAAINIISKVKDSAHYELFLNFFFSEIYEIRFAAVLAAGEIKNHVWIPVLFDLLQDKSLRQEIIFSLSFYGISPAQEISKRLSSNPVQFDIYKYEYIKILENSQGELSADLLFSFLPKSNIESRNLVLSSLSMIEFMPTKERLNVLHKILNDEFHFAYWILNSLDCKKMDGRMKNSLLYEIDICKNRVFLCLGLIYDSVIVKKAEAALNLASKEKKANALEILDQIIPRKIHDYLLALVDNISLKEKLSKLKLFVLIDGDPTELFILKKGKLWFSNWTISSALETVELNNKSISTIVPLIQEPAKIIRQSAVLVLNKFKRANETSFNYLLKNLNLEISDNDMLIDNDNQRLSEIEKVILLKSTALFAGTPENVIAEIVGIVKEEFIPKDHIIFRKGDSGSSMYVIYEGEVKIHDGNNVFTVLRSHDFFGELALLDPEPRSASATAISDTLLLMLNEEDAYELMEERVEVLKSIMKLLCKRIRLQNAEITSNAMKVG